MIYVQNYIIGMAILLVPLISNHNDNNRDWKRLRTIMIVTAADMTIETACLLLEGRMFLCAGNLIYFLCSATILLQSFIGLLWLFYSLRLLGISIRNPFLRFAAFIPFIINTIDLIMNPFTHYRFIISDTNSYELGTLAYLDIAVTLSYMLISTIVALLKSASTKNAMERRNCYIISAFIILPLMGIVLQSIFSASYFVLTFFAIGLLITFINIQNRQITTDFLTKTNNRSYLLMYYDRILSHFEPDDSLYMFIIDIDRFKKINDSLGHNTGDAVLIQVSNVLKKACSDNASFLARIGGDEFCILYEGITEQHARSFIEKISLLFRRYNQTSSLQWPVTVSIGYARYDDSMPSFNALMKEADKMMYRAKAGKPQY